MAYTRVGFEDPDYIEGEPVSGGGSFNRSNRQAAVDAINADYNAHQDQQMAADQAVRDAETASVSADFGKKLTGRWDPTTQTYSENVWRDAIRKMNIEAQRGAADAQLAENEAFSKDFDTSVGISQKEDMAKLDLMNRCQLKAVDGMFMGNGLLNPYAVRLIQNVLGPDYLGSVMTRKNGKIEFNTLVRDKKTGRVVPDPHKLSMEDVAVLASKYKGILSPQSQAIVSNYINKNYTRRQQIEAGLTDLNPDLLHDRAMMYGSGVGSAGGRTVGGVAANGAVARALFGRGGDNRSTVSTYSTRDGGVERVYNGHTGEDTGYVHRDPVRAAREVAGRWKQTGIGPASSDPKDTKQVRTYENTATGEVVRVKDGETPPWREKKNTSGNLSFDERKRLQDERIAAQAESRKETQQAITDRAKMSAEARKHSEELSSILKQQKQNRDKYGTIIDPDKEKALQERLDALSGSMSKSAGEDAGGQGGGQAEDPKEDNSGKAENWGSLTPEQIKKVKAKGGTYDSKTGEIVLPDGRRKKI